MTIEEKYNIIYKGKERFYRYLLSDNRRQDLDNTRPEETVIESIIFNDNSWINLLVNICKYILHKNFMNEDQLLSFRVQWYDKTIFTKTIMTNFREVDNGIYVNCNMGSVRTYWLICDLLYNSNIYLNRSHITIKRYGVSEPKEVKDYVINKNLELYHNHLVNRYENESVVRLYEKKIKELDGYLNKVNPNRATYSIFLIDTKRLLYNTKVEVLDYLKGVILNEKEYRSYERTFEDYYEFMKLEFKN